MGREIKRVPLGFDWPMGEIWPGYRMSICGAVNENGGCEKCEHFARLLNLEYADHGCPITPMAPPEGEAYQVWETTSEGSPMTPPFSTPEELAQYCVDNKISTFASMTADYDTWLEWARGPGWAPSAAMTISATGGQMVSGVEAMAQEESISAESPHLFIGHRLVCGLASLVLGTQGTRKGGLMNKTQWYWQDTALLLLIPVFLVFFLNVGMWSSTLSNQEPQPWQAPRPQWYVSALVTLVTVVIPTILLSAHKALNDRLIQ